MGDKLQYIGEGAWIPGVPARDLSEDEAATHADAIKATEKAGHRLYVPVTHDPPPAKANRQAKGATEKVSDDNA